MGQFTLNVSIADRNCLFQYYFRMLNLSDIKTECFARPVKICVDYLLYFSHSSFVVYFFRRFFIFPQLIKIIIVLRSFMGFETIAAFFSPVYMRSKRRARLLQICNLRDLIKMNSWQPEIKLYKYQSEK